MHEQGGSNEMLGKALHCWHTPHLLQGCRQMHHQDGVPLRIVCRPMHLFRRQERGLCRYNVLEAPTPVPVSVA